MLTESILKDKDEVGARTRTRKVIRREGRRGPAQWFEYDLVADPWEREPLPATDAALRAAIERLIERRRVTVERH